jgi:hypothetical protein
VEHLKRPGHVQALHPVEQHNQQAPHATSLAAGPSWQQ